jgi:tuftelin-interacting protein 11
VESWRALLPDFIYHNLVNHLIVSKLSISIQGWNPRTSLKRKHGTPLPHIWLFPWLQFLSPHHTDPSSSTGLLTEVKRKFRVVLDTWDLSRGVLPGLEAWSSVLGPTLQDALIRHLLPRLSRLLAADFQVYPPDQDLTPLEQVLKWEKFFKPSVMGQLLTAEFFPKWINTLHAWLTSDGANYDEVGQWYTWWKSQIPADINAVQAVAEKWDEGLVMMNQAMDLGDEAATQLPPPMAGPARPVASAPKVKEADTPSKTKKAAEIEATFKDVVEEWCEQEGLMLIPLREAHDITGLPLFRITASASGKGGVVVYLKGDVLWARQKNDKTAFEPIGLEQRLVDRAEGK